LTLTLDHPAACFVWANCQGQRRRAAGAAAGAPGAAGAAAAPAALCHAAV